MEQLILLSPPHISLEHDGYGEFPNSYIVTKEGIEYIKEYFNKIKKEKENE